MRRVNCLKCFYMMQVFPDKEGNAKIATCYYNRYLPGNEFVVKDDLVSAWNSRQLQFQRGLALQGGGGMCFEADCSTNLHKRAEEKALVDGSECLSRAIECQHRELDSLPLIIEVFPSFGCNNFCHFCFYQKFAHSKDKFRLKAHLIEELKTVFFPKAEWIIVNGGDPLCSSEGWDLMEWLVAAKLQKKIMLKTNGVLLEKFGLERLIESGVEMQITLFGMDAETYRRVTGADHFKCVMATIERILALGAGQLLELTFVVTDENFGQAEEFCAWIERHPSVKGVMWNNFLLGMKYRSVLQKMKERYGHLAMRFHIYNVDGSLLRRLWRGRYWPVHFFKYRTAMR